MIWRCLPGAGAMAAQAVLVLIDRRFRTVMPSSALTPSTGIAMRESSAVARTSLPGWTVRAVAVHTSCVAIVHQNAGLRRVVRLFPAGIG